MSKLKKQFTRKQWDGCCGKGCKKCEIAQAYIHAYGKAEGLEKLNHDRTQMQSKKGAKKKGKG